MAQQPEFGGSWTQEKLNALSKYLRAYNVWQSLLDPAEQIEKIYKVADERKISEYLVSRLQQEFQAVANPLPLRNSTGSLLFLLYFAAGNERSEKTGIKIANSIVGA